VLAGGIERYVTSNAKLGIHQSKVPKHLSSHEGGQLSVVAAALYLREMGVDEGIALAAAAVPNNSMYWIPVSEALKTGCRRAEWRHAHADAALALAGGGREPHLDEQIARRAVEYLQRPADVGQTRRRGANQQDVPRARDDAVGAGEGRELWDQCLRDLMPELDDGEGVVGVGAHRPQEEELRDHQLGQHQQSGGGDDQRKAAGAAIGHVGSGG
jgi:hypothetical protein